MARQRTKASPRATRSTRAAKRAAKPKERKEEEEDVVMGEADEPQVEAAESAEQAPPAAAVAAKPRTPKKRTVEGEAIRTFLRIRPVDVEEDEELTLEKLETGHVRAQAPESSWAFRNGDEESHEYQFTEVFDGDSDQQSVYKKAAALHVQRLFNGNNGMLVAYGSSGSGKTHTILGSQEMDEGEGIALRVMRRIFDKVNCLMADQERAISEAAAAGEPGPPKSLYFVFLTCHEIYNEQIFDLLAEQPKDLKDRPAKVLKYDMKGKPNVKGQVEKKVDSAEEGVQLLLDAYQNRVSAATLVNDNSSRSHALVTIKLARIRTTTSMEQLHQDPKQHLRVSKFAIVDLAGNERGQKTQSTGARQQEAGNINLSLMKLGRCISVLRSNQLSSDQQKQVVPYRESKLTRLLQEYFDSQSQTSIVVCVSPAPDCYDEVTHSLKFGLAAQEVSVGPAKSKAAVRNSLYAPTAASKSRDAARTPRATAAAPRTPATARRKRSVSRKGGDDAVKPVAPEEDVEHYKQQLQAMEERLADLEADIREEVSDELQGILQMMRVTYEQRIQQKLMEEEERFNMRLQLLSGLHMPERQEEHLQSIPSSEELVEWCRSSSQNVDTMAQVDGEAESPPPPMKKRKRKGDNEEEEEEGEKEEEEETAPLKMDDLHITLQSSYEQLRETHCSLLAEHERLLGQMEVAREMDSQKQKQMNQMRIQVSSFSMEKEMLEETIRDLQQRLTSGDISSNAEAVAAIEAAMASPDASRETDERQRGVIVELQKKLAKEQCDNSMLANQVTELKELYRMLLKQQSTMARSSSSKSNVLEASSESVAAEVETTPKSSGKVQGTLRKMLTPKKSLLTPRKRNRNNKEVQPQHTTVQDIDEENGTTRTFRGEIQPSLTGQGVSVCFTDVQMVETMKTDDFIAAKALGKKRGRERSKQKAPGVVPRLNGMQEGGLGESGSSISSQNSQLFGLVDCNSETSVNYSVGDVSSHLMSPMTTEPLESSMMAPMDDWPQEESEAVSIAHDVYGNFSRPSYISLSPQGRENEQNPPRDAVNTPTKRDSFVEVSIDAAPAKGKGKARKGKGKAKKAAKVDKADKRTPGWSRRLRTRD